MNTFGKNLRLSTFGESHGKAIGGIIDGFPSGFKINFDLLYSEIAKRSPGSSTFVTQRKESDLPQFLSGIDKNGVTLGTSIGFVIKNADNREDDYLEVAEKYRPNHADYTYEAKYGIRDYQGGGRASARETANWVVAGALATQWLQSKGIKISSELTSVGDINYTDSLTSFLSKCECDSLFIPQAIKDSFTDVIISAKNSGDSIGGIVTGLITGLPIGIGEPIADKLHARLAYAMMSINAAKGFEYGFGMKSAQMKGSEILDILDKNKEGNVYTKSNYSGGIQGGITNGMPVYFNVAFKPTPTIMKDIPTITKELKHTTLKMKGRHDPCVAVRAVSIVKAMTALVIADFLL